MKSSEYSYTILMLTKYLIYIIQSYVLLHTGTKNVQLPILVNLRNQTLRLLKFCWLSCLLGKLSQRIYAHTKLLWIFLLFLFSSLFNEHDSRVDSRNSNQEMNFLKNTAIIERRSVVITKREWKHFTFFRQSLKVE